MPQKCDANDRFQHEDEDSEERNAPSKISDEKDPAENSVENGEDEQDKDETDEFEPEVKKRKIAV